MRDNFFDKMSKSFNSDKLFPLPRTTFGSVDIFHRNFIFQKISQDTSENALSRFEDNFRLIYKDNSRRKMKELTRKFSKKFSGIFVGVGQIFRKAKKYQTFVYTVS